uniref:EF-hand domain-containing protein n=1 Tax=Chrysotila carterae TaxID=13221 RepID=A0A7S4BJC5_CHRCT
MPVASTLRLGRARAPVFRACASGLDSDMGTTFYQDSLCDEEEEACELPEDDEFTVAILGDLHLDPRKMEDYYAGREHFKPILEDATARGVNAALVSLGDLGESKSVRPEETAELFAGTSECHELAADFLGSFGVPYEVIGGNHDLEGIDEFSTDEENLEAFLRIHNKPTPQFSRLIADKTMLVGLCSTVFRSAKYTSHEVIIDDEQLRWFEKLLEDHPADEGWKLFVFSHAPPIGSGLRVLQENHVVNGCCWLNHSGGDTTRKFIELVRKHRCVKAWFSGHFHLGQDYEDSITFPTIPREVGPYPNRGSCVFAQTSVMRSGSSRDGRQQSRLLRGNKDGFQICTVQHSGDNAGAVRLDATITYKDTSHEVGVYAHEHAELKAKDNFIKVYSPSAGDECYISYDDEGSLDPTKGQCVDDGTIAWWHMSDGRVLGMYDGRLIEYEPSTLAPLGLVVGADELAGRRVMVIGSGAEECRATSASFSMDTGMEGADCADAESAEQAVLLIDDATKTVTVVQPNEDGSYWRKIVRNKMIRMKEKRRQQAGYAYAKEIFGDDAAPVVSSWGPYTSIVGTAKTTGVPGLTKKSKEAWSAVGGGRAAEWRRMGDELQQAFARIDADGSGLVSVSELRSVMKKLDASCTDATIDEMMVAADADGDGRISLAEFTHVMLFGTQRLTNEPDGSEQATTAEPAGVA